MGDLLVIDDEPDVALLLKASLEAFGHDVAIGHTAGEAIDLTQSRDCDLLLIDLGLPDADGKDAVRAVRAAGAIPIIVVTSRHAIHERVAALDAGADDYITKPFSVDELAARVRAQLRRAHARPESAQVLSFEEVEIDVAGRRVMRAGECIHFTPTELQMLVLLARRANQLVTHNELYREVWPDGSAESGHYVRVYIQQIRSKLGDDATNPTFIATELSHGYRWLPVPFVRADPSS